MPKKFITTDVYSSERFPYGSVLPLEFMEVYVMIAAQKKGFAVYRALNQSLREEDGKIIGDLVEIKFKNIELLERISADPETLKSVINASDARLKTLKDLGKSELEKHDQKTFPFSVGYLNRICTEFEDEQTQDVIALITELAKREPAIPFDPTQGFLDRTIHRQENLEEFLQAEDTAENENVFYIRSLVRADDYKVLPLLERLRQNTKAKFPTTPESQKFYDKQIVIDDAVLRQYAMPTICCEASETEFLKDFYRSNCSSEGLVLKPGNGGSFGGTGIAVLEPNLTDEELSEEISKALLKMHGDVDRHYKTDFSLQNIVAQKRLNNLSADGDLRGGDIRFSIINGELVGAALRYSDNSEVKILSYELTKSVLPDNLSFTVENIEMLKERASEEDKAYYATLLKMHEAVTSVVSWSRENKHFHIGVDMLLGRDSEGNWQFCLTEVNNVIPDCIPETQHLNTLAGESEARQNICKSIVDIVENNRHITADAESILRPPSPSFSNPRSDLGGRTSPEQVGFEGAA